MPAGSAYRRDDHMLGRYLGQGSSDWTVEFVPLARLAKATRHAGPTGPASDSERRRATPSTGKVRIPVLFVDFRDVHPLTMSTHDERPSSGLAIRRAVPRSQQLRATRCGIRSPAPMAASRTFNSDHYEGILIDNRRDPSTLPWRGGDPTGRRGVRFHRFRHCAGSPSQQPT